MEEGKYIGKITHYFNKIGVAVIQLEDDLRVGDKIKIVGPHGEFEQVVESMEVEHKKITEAKSGESIGLKVNQKVKEGYKVFKV